MKRFMLLSANNINTEIDVMPCETLIQAQVAMKADFETVRKELGYVEEEEINETSASLYTSYNDGDLYYWQIKEVEV